jgi:hypothetical protein
VIAGAICGEVDNWEDGDAIAAGEAGGGVLRIESVTLIVLFGLAVAVEVTNSASV